MFLARMEEMSNLFVKSEEKLLTKPKPNLRNYNKVEFKNTAREVIE